MWEFETITTGSTWYIELHVHVEGQVRHPGNLFLLTLALPTNGLLVTILFVETTVYCGIELLFTTCTKHDYTCTLYMLMYYLTETQNILKITTACTCVPNE